MPDITSEQVDRMVAEISAARPRGWVSQEDKRLVDAKFDDDVREILRKWLGV